ncbi:MAG: hypothetical protein FJ008_02600 [Chloroflexi bacterium]|nr:hypothetical protein [Chloroflexota bacterium]MBM3173207.1 hypothetical protein [Chloroflexota bacterium]MBM3175724.1 hypothetical protein [Chloroflexota bacterium]MBM4449432.1 hypothetical protein [Chloroflexota bacterium]
MKIIKGTRTATLLLLAVLALSLIAACSGISKPKLLKYTNNEYGYSISYPEDWQVEVADKGKTCLLTPTAGFTTGSIRIDAIPSVPIERAAQSWEMAMGSQWGEITRYENKKMQGQWDWYLSYGWVTEEGLEFQGEAYFKYTPSYAYKVDTAARAKEYDQYSFNKIIASFKLLDESN